VSPLRRPSHRSAASKDQTLGNETDSGIGGSGTGSGTPVGNRDSGVTGHHDSGTPGSGTGSGGGGTCGDRTCESGETCSSCPVDCGACEPGRDAGGGGTCGDGVCGFGETCSSCPGDCGACPGVDSGTADAGPPAYCPTTEGTTGTVIVSGQTRLGAMDIDTTNVYWAADVELNTGGTVLTLPKTGAGSPVTLATNQPSAFSIATTSSTLYWATAVDSETMPSGNYSYVRSLPLPASGTGTPAQFWTAGTGILDGVYAFNLATDSANLYWYDLGYSVVVEAPLDGSTPISIGPPDGFLDDPPVGLAVDATNIYSLWWGAPMGQSGSTVTLVSTPKAAPGTWSTLWSQPSGDTYTDSNMSADATGVYWVYQAGDEGTASASIWSLPAGGIPTELATGLTQPFGLADDGVNIYYSDNFNLWSLPITGGTPTVVAANEYAGVIRFDATYVYWANGCTGTIKKLAK